MREPKEDEARLLQLGSEEERPPPPPPPWLFFLEMVMGCDMVKHFREEEEAAAFSGK